MLRAMVFIDYMNFQVASTRYTSELKLPNPRLDYNVLPHVVCSKITNSILLKTLLFAPKPDPFLMQDNSYMKQYDWLNGLKNYRYLDVMEGDYIARPMRDGEPKNINDKNTYYKVEKGTDINISVEAITKAFNNAYDVAIFMSGDSDYIPIYKTLRTIGKIVVVAAIKGQNIKRILPYVDNHIYIDIDMLNEASRNKEQGNP